MEFNADILDYMGTFEDGVFVLITIQYKDVFYDATYFYNKEHLVLTIPDDMEAELGIPIASHPDYENLIRMLLKKTIPYNEIFNRLDAYVPK